MNKEFSNKIEAEQYLHSKLFQKKDIVIKNGKGAILIDENDNEYIDCVAGHAVVNIGHSHPKYVEAVKNQLEQLVMVSPSYPMEIRYKLLEKLARITPKPLSQTFLGNSGTEAIEAALKLALAVNRDKKNPEVIAFKRAFHGRTLGSLAMTHNMKYRKPFLPWLSSHVKFASYGDIDSVKELVNDNTIAVFIELIQGEGGVYPAPYDFVRELRELCDQNNILLIDDEVQTGFGRTGKMFAFEHYDIVPDAMCMAKAIAGGMPMGAMISSEELYEKMQIGEHSTTYGGNPLCCAAANAVIDIIQEEGIVTNADTQGKKLLNDLNKYAEEERLIREVRGKGLMIGVDYRIRVNDLINKAQDMNVLLLNAGLTTIRILPPLVINDLQVERVLEVMHKLT
ncbi:MAG: [LysW]-aminoadipate semialdehyde/glutamate semialdehyde transaminase [Promethearchaeota archaeon]|nr:MAG: [LysW]-aminoadipate semialdehyde/glutamate semialdehyde transaminase [Candidatus Lokiarchaeota archaeon]